MSYFVTSAFNFETVTVATTSIGLTTTLNDNVGFRAVISCETAQCRYRYDGGAPTATVGHLLNIGDLIIFEGRANVANFRAIRTGGTSAVLQVTIETF